MALKHKFYVVKDEVCVELEEKKSKFLGFTKSLRSEQEVKAYLSVLSNTFHDATHICYAFVLGQQYSISKSNDNGEPAGTAGLPILSAIKKANLTNTLVAVVRYYGGKPLGANGLTRIYNKTASKALEKAGKYVMIECAVYECRFTYSDFALVAKYFRENDYPILKQDYSDVIRVECAFPVELEQKVFSDIQTIIGSRFINNKLRNSYFRFNKEM